MRETAVSDQLGADERIRLRRLEAEAEEVRRARDVLLDGEQAHARAARLAEELGAARTEIAELRARLERSAEAMAAIQASPSWRLTAPLRALKRAVRRTA